MDHRMDGQTHFIETMGASKYLSIFIDCAATNLSYRFGSRFSFISDRALDTFSMDSLDVFVTPESVSKCLSRNVFVIATVFVNEVSKMTLKSPSAEMTLGFRCSGTVSSTVDAASVDASIDDVGNWASPSGETSGDTGSFAKQ